MGTANERIAKEIKDYLAENGISMTDAASKLGVSQQAISNQLSGRKMGENVARKWAEAFGFNALYLLTGEGSLLQGQESRIAEKKVEDNTVPLLPIFAQAGHLTGWSEGVMEIDCERVISPVKDIDMAVHIYGESMYPDIPNGSVVYVRKVQSILDWGRAYILDTVDGPLLKYLAPGHDDEHIKCISANPDAKFAPFEVTTESVLGFYRVVMVMSMK